MSQPPQDMPQPPENQQWPTYRADDTSALPDSPVGDGPAVPAVQPPVPAVPQPAGPTGLSRPGYVPHDPLQISAGGSGIKKEGVWTVPPYLSIHGDFGSVRLDFRRAEVSSRVIWVQVSGGAGSIVLILPEGWAAQLDRLTPGWGSRKSTVAEEPVGNNPVLVLSGSAGMGSIRVRYPTPRDERRLRRLLARERKRLR